MKVRTSILIEKKIIFGFDREYYFSGMLSSIPLNIFEKILDEHHLLWLGVQSGGADFKGVSSSSFVCMDAKMGITKSDAKEALQQSLHGARQIYNHIKNHTSYFGSPKKLVVGVIFPEIKETLNLEEIYKDIIYGKNYGAGKEAHIDAIKKLLLGIDQTVIFSISMERFFYEDDLYLKVRADKFDVKIDYQKFCVS